MSINIRTRHFSNNTDDAALSWTVHLAREHPAKTVVSIIGIIVACLTAYLVINSIIASVIIGIALIASLADFLFPVKYVLTSRSAACFMPFKKAEILWADVNNCYLDDMGIKLSPLNRTSRLEAFRGVYLRFSDNKEAVIEAVKSLKELR